MPARGRTGQRAARATRAQDDGLLRTQPQLPAATAGRGRPRPRPLQLGLQNDAEAASLHAAGGPGLPQVVRAADERHVLRKRRRQRHFRGVLLRPGDVEAAALPQPGGLPAEHEEALSAGFAAGRGLFRGHGEGVDRQAVEPAGRRLRAARHRGAERGAGVLPPRLLGSRRRSPAGQLDFAEGPRHQADGLLYC